MNKKDIKIVIKYLEDKGIEATLREFNIDNILLRKIEHEAFKNDGTRIYFNDTIKFERYNGATDKILLWKLHNHLFKKWLKTINHKDKTILLLKWTGYKQGEIGYILSETQGAVSQRLKMLKKEYKRFFNLR